MKAGPSQEFLEAFHRTPGLCVLLDPAFVILAQNQAHAQATLTTAKPVVGKHLFEVYPDNPDHAAAEGVAALRDSLLKVLKTRQADVMPLIRYDVQAERGPYQTRWWRVTNTPVLGDDGYVQWIINQAEDVRELVAWRKQAGLPLRP